MVLKKNRIFNIGTLIFVCITGIIASMQDLGDGVLWLSEHRNSFSNLYFPFITKIGEEWAYVLILFFFLFYKYRYAIMLPVLALLVSAVSLTLKSIFGVARPKSFFMDAGIFNQIELVQGIELYTGNTSFPSGHTISAFALFGFFAYVLRKYKAYGLILLLLAISVALSRVYIVQHFLRDVSVGALIGCLIAVFVAWLSSRLDEQKYPFLEKNLLSQRDSRIKA